MPLEACLRPVKSEGLMMGKMTASSSARLASSLPNISAKLTSVVLIIVDTSSSLYFLLTPLYKLSFALAVGLGVIVLIGLLAVRLEVVALVSVLIRKCRSKHRASKQMSLLY